jgi:hypothetical protein
MHIRRTAVIAALIVLGSSGVLRNVLAGETREKGGVALEARIVKRSRDATWLRLELANWSGRELWVNKRMAWNYEDAPGIWREITLEVWDGAGHVVPYVCKSHIGDAGPVDYVVLFSSEFVGRTLKLDCLELKSGTKYKLVAHYRDSNTSVKPPGGLFPRLDWEVVSNPVEFVAP